MKQTFSPWEYIKPFESMRNSNHGLKSLKLIENVKPCLRLMEIIKRRGKCKNNESIEVVTKHSKNKENVKKQ